MSATEFSKKNVVHHVYVCEEFLLENTRVLRLQSRTSQLNLKTLDMAFRYFETHNPRMLVPCNQLTIRLF